ncbi:MAG TPA: D-aminoacylase [Methylomirabilota bacterium]|nr:D-aminoacylase [Methylomirabilota bacterium]
MLSLVLRGGRVVDGTGRPAYDADVGLAGDTIVAIGPGLPAASVEMDARGQVVAPGFVDIHTHSDYTLLLNRNAESAVRQGVTTELVGNCGMSCAPLADPVHLPLAIIDYLPGVDIGWRRFAEWLEALGRDGVSINVGGLVGHGALRLAAMGPEPRPATPAEVGRMVGLLEESLEAGAFGLSSGLEYPVGKTATSEELVALATAVGRRGGLYATHIRNRDYSYETAIDEALDTARAARVRLQISHVSPRWGVREGGAEAAMGAIRHARAAGLDVAFDNHPYLLGRGLVMAALPPWAFEGGVRRLRERLRDPRERARMRANENPQWKHVHQGRWDLLSVYDAPANRDLHGQTIQELAAARRCDPWDVVFDLLADEGDNPSSLFWSAPLHRQEDVDATFRDPDCVVISDGSTVAPYGPCRDVRHIYSYGWASHLLRRYVRERGVLTLEGAVHKLTEGPARRMGLTDRGTLGPGQKADLVVFDPATVVDRASFEHPIAFPAGIRYVFVNGVLTVRDGEHTSARAGRLLRRAG